MSGETKQKKVVVERIYRATLQEVWELWTTKEGFESWWGPVGFRADVHELVAEVGGPLRYDMVAATPEMRAAMEQAGRPPGHPVRATFVEVAPRQRLVLRNVMDFLPGVPPYEADIEVDLEAMGDRVRMRVTLGGLHSAAFDRMQEEGFTSQLTKLDERFGAAR